MASEELCLKALDRYETELGGRPEVVGLGIVSADESKPDGDDLAVAVYVDRSLEGMRGAAPEAIPGSLEFEDERKVLHRVPVRVIEQGPVELEMEPPELP